MKIICALALMVCVSAQSVFAGAAAEAAQEEDMDVIVQYKTDAPAIPQTKVIKDDYVQVVGQYRNTTVKREGYLVKEVLYADKDANYALAVDKRDEGRFTLAALHFTNALENMKDRKWAAEYCNYNIGNAFYSAGIFNGYKGRALTYAPAAEYFKRALEANPKSRYMLDMVVKLPVCYAEQNKLKEADEAITDAEGRIKKYISEPGPLGLGYAAPAWIVQTLSWESQRLTLRKRKWPRKSRAHDGAGRARSLARSAAGKAKNHPDLMGECVDGELRGLILMQQYTVAIAEANKIIEDFNLKENEYSAAAAASRRIYVPGQGGLLSGARASSTKRKAIQKSERETTRCERALGVFEDVIAQFFRTTTTTWPSRISGSDFVMRKLKDVEPTDAVKKAIREWQSVVTNFPKSAFKEGTP